MSQAEKLITKNDAYGTVGVPAAAAAPKGKSLTATFCGACHFCWPIKPVQKTRPSQEYIISCADVSFRKQTACGDVCSALLLVASLLKLWHTLQHDLTAHA